MSAWNRSSSTCRSRNPSSRALRSAPMTARKTWSSMRALRVVPKYGRLVSDRSNSDNPWLERRVLNYAHQGGAAEAPSSTLFAFDRAVALGAEALEMDVHATSDGELVVCHDATVDATTQTTGAIAAMTLEEVRSLDNAYRFSADGDGLPYRGQAPQDRRFGVAT